MCVFAGVVVVVLVVVLFCLGGDKGGVGLWVCGSMGFCVFACVCFVCVCVCVCLRARMFLCGSLFVCVIVCVIVCL